MTTYDDMLRQSRHEAAPRRPPRDEEHRLQTACVRWFRLQYPRLRHVLFAVPNGGRRDRVTGSRLKDEGAVPGVADLILLKSNRRHGALAVEMKTPQGAQSPSQREWQREAEAVGVKYAVCRSLEEFMDVVNEYLNEEL